MGLCAVWNAGHDNANGPGINELIAVNLYTKKKNELEAKTGCGNVTRVYLATQEMHSMKCDSRVTTDCDRIAEI
jgi:hypothetical protein